MEIFKSVHFLDAFTIFYTNPKILLSITNQEIKSYAPGMNFERLLNLRGNFTFPSSA